MTYLKGMLPLGLAGLVIAAALGFVRYFDAYEAPGEHWAPASPIAHEPARFMTDMGSPGDYIVKVEKLESKFPLLFVEYQTPGPVLDLTVHSDDGIIRLDQRFADEGRYRISVQHTIHPMHREEIEFTVQTPLSKYAVDALLFLMLLAAGYFSGRRLRELSLAALLLMALAAPGGNAWAHGGGGHAAEPLGAETDGIALGWVAGHAPHGEANRAPMDWRLRLTKNGKPVRHALYDLEFVHLESGQPVLHVQGATVNGVIPLRYSPPDGTDYQLFVRAIVDGKAYHLALEGAADAIRPTAAREWESFLLLMLPAVAGMMWGWRRAGRA